MKLTIHTIACLTDIREQQVLTLLLFYYLIASVSDIFELIKVRSFCTFNEKLSLSIQVITRKRLIMRMLLSPDLWAYDVQLIY